MKRLCAIVASLIAAGCAKNVIVTQKYDMPAPAAIVEQKSPEHYLAIKKSENQRQNIISAGLAQQNVYLFGHCLDDMVRMADISRNNKIRLKIPEYFFKDMDWRLVANLDEASLTIYNNGRQIMKTEINSGGWNYDNRTKSVRWFKTKVGTFYISRIVMNPFYYDGFFSRTPKKKHLPGRKNPYGIFMIDPSLEPVKPSYAFKSEKHAGFNIHSTNNWNGPGRDSHSCVRVNPPDMEELGRAIIFYYGEEVPEKNGRGTIYKLKKHIPLEVVGDNSPQANIK